MRQLNENKLKKQLSVAFLLAAYIAVLAYLSKYII